MVTVTYAPDKQGKIDDYIRQSNKLSLSRKRLMLRVREGDIICPYQGLIPRYIGVLRDKIISHTFTDEQFHHYMFNPMRLSKDLYGTPEFWSDLLYINNMVSVTEFKKRKINIFTETIIDACGELLMLCDQDIKNNEHEISGGMN